MDEIRYTFPQNLAYWLKRSGMSAKDAAEKVGVSESAMSTWINGRNIPRMDKVDRLCKLFGCTRADLLDAPDCYESKRARAEAILARLTDEELAAFLILYDKK